MPSFSYHQGERRVQGRAGRREAAGRLAGAVTAEIPEVAAGFLSQQVILLIGHRAASGEMWASVLAGPPSFVAVRDPRTVLIRARPHQADPLSASKGSGEFPLGVLAIEPSTKRRMRINGRGVFDGERLLVRAEQVFANCPKYISRRRAIEQIEEAPALAAPPARFGRELDLDQRATLAATDTFFVATAHDETGADVSHRGGNPGFVAVRDSRHLTWPDYRGNSMFMTLGNLDLDARAGLLVADWGSGDLLQLTGKAVTDWDPERTAAFPGAERVIDFTLDRAVTLPRALGWRWQLEQRSRSSPPVADRGSGAAQGS